MSSHKQRVLDAVNHKKYDKIPIDFWSTAETDKKLFEHFGLTDRSQLLDEFDVAHQNNMFVYFHCCGAVRPIIPDLIDAGVNIINFDQPRLHGIKELSDKYAGKVTFCCPVDIQATLPKGDKKLIEQEANELVKYLNRGGGFIAKIYGGWEGVGLDFDPSQYSKEVFSAMQL